ncbi:methylated-DNA--[protein]-cysteine S-methyltransferase [Flavobacterium sp. NKUCC04_CG]|uniref:methylated-DNA--[protein]-cysteine S-methyltransferase n=1 Tax=Flavobacterium sp. NKUCC04_CG TaxID=2842121 RepID=UPI001C5BCB89|nr:methylated-DNA--[protein]-cysteine S-methyltransferase [Flavobacterium sp. NKUCC04_CG]MBW3519766.1 methylated-DNA--[protein]-cysteine S-methyltransferase [Flavobacterium sp. NKUCC04_CG]
MKEQKKIQYDRIAEVIEHIQNNFKQQPSLEQLAAVVHLSPFHFQRLFTEWAGTSPKKFLQYISIGYAKQLLMENRDISLAEMAFQTGLSSSSRLHDLFVKIEGMTPAEFKNGGENLMINYDIVESPFGMLILASTSKGICHMAFEVDKNQAIAQLVNRFPNAVLEQKSDEIQQTALKFFQSDSTKLCEVKLHLKGTDFQLKVWESLLKIPMGQLTTYGDIAKEIGKPSAFRAVGTAIGKNPIAFLIPCHRVIQASGQLGGYMWGINRKTAIIGWEGAKAASQDE